jgi:hypothetical protein
MAERALPFKLKKTLGQSLFIWGKFSNRKLPSLKDPMQQSFAITMAES